MLSQVVLDGLRDTVDQVRQPLQLAVVVGLEEREGEDVEADPLDLIIRLEWETRLCGRLRRRRLAGVQARVRPPLAVVPLALPPRGVLRGVPRILRVVLRGAETFLHDAPTTHRLPLFKEDARRPFRLVPDLPGVVLLELLHEPLQVLQPQPLVAVREDAEADQHVGVGELARTTRYLKKH